MQGVKLKVGEALFINGADLKLGHNIYKVEISAMAILYPRVHLWRAWVACGLCGYNRMLLWAVIWNKNTGWDPIASKCSQFHFLLWETQNYWVNIMT